MSSFFKNRLSKNIISNLISNHLKFRKYPETRPWILERLPDIGTVHSWRKLKSLSAGNWPDSGRAPLPRRMHRCSPHLVHSGCTVNRIRSELFYKRLNFDLSGVSGERCLPVVNERCTLHLNMQRRAKCSVSRVMTLWVLLDAGTRGSFLRRCFEFRNMQRWLFYEVWCGFWYFRRSILIRSCAKVKVS